MVAGFWVAQPPLCDCPPLAEAGLLCIANVLARRLPSSVKEALQLGFVSLAVLAGPASQLMLSEIRVLSLPFADRAHWGHTVLACLPRSLESS